ncbi:MAG: hypothetical protein NVS2B15_08310 [Pseudarthrobacter sp.]
MPERNLAVLAHVGAHVPAHGVERKDEETVGPFLAVRADPVRVLCAGEPEDLFVQVVGGAPLYV